MTIHEAAMKLALIGDHSEHVVAHRAIPLALEIEADARGASVEFDWLATDSLKDASVLSGYCGGWVVPASPYASFENALAAIQYLRENDMPFLGTCGGYQHALVEYARSVLGYPDAGITEIDPDCPMPLVSSLVCALIDETAPVQPTLKGLIETLCGPGELSETYRCSFGLNPAHAHIFENTELRVAARDPDGAVRAMSLDGHRFYLGCAFQPERAALEGKRHPIVAGFVSAAANV